MDGGGDASADATVLQIQQSLDEFLSNNKPPQPDDDRSIIPLALMNAIIVFGAQHGEVVRDVVWEKVREFLVIVFDLTLVEFIRSSGTVAIKYGESFDERCRRVRRLLRAFPRPPFTYQRMCELLKEPQRHYRTTTKFFEAFSKLVCGISSGNVIDVHTPSPMDTVLTQPITPPPPPHCHDGEESMLFGKTNASVPILTMMMDDDDDDDDR